MHPRSDAEQVILDALEGYVLGTLPPAQREMLEAHLAADATLLAELAEARTRVAAMYQATSPATAVHDAVDDLVLAAYLDNALAESDREALEKQFSSDPQLVARLVGLYRATMDVTDSNSAVELKEKFLAGEVVSFQREKTSLTQETPISYVSLEEAFESRKRRYLQG